MTHTAQLPVIRTEAALVACCAPMLGFEPDESVVAFIQGVPGRGSSPVLARADLGDGRDVPDRAQALAESIVRIGGDEVHLVAWIRSTPDDAARRDLIATAFIAELRRLLARRSVPVNAALATNGRVAWDQCADPSCCQDAAPLDLDELTTTRAEFAYAGFAPLGSREDLAVCLAADPQRCEQVARLVAASRAPRTRDAWRRAQVRDVCRVLVPTDVPAARVRPVRRPATPQLTERVCARILLALADAGIRDAVLLQLVRSHAPAGQWAVSIDRLSDLVRSAPPGQGAGAASLLAAAAWLRGNGALARVALEAAVRHDPEYRLAALLGAVIEAGLDPERWRASFEGLTVDRCLAATAVPPVGSKVSGHAG